MNKKCNETDEEIRKTNKKYNWFDGDTQNEQTISREHSFKTLSPRSAIRKGDGK